MKKNRRFDEERREEVVVARWHGKEVFLAEDGGLMVWKLREEAGAQTPPPSTRVPGVWECRQWPPEGAAGKAVSTQVSALQARGRQTSVFCEVYPDSREGTVY